MAASYRTCVHVLALGRILFCRGLSQGVAVESLLKPSYRSRAGSLPHWICSVTNPVGASLLARGPYRRHSRHQAITIPSALRLFSATPTNVTESVAKRQHRVLPDRRGMRPEVLRRQHTLHPEKHQFVLDVITQHPILTKRAVEQERIRPAPRFHQVITGAADKHVIAHAADQVIVAVQPKQPVATGMRLERIGAAGALHAGLVLRDVVADLQAAGRDAVGHVVLEQAPEKPGSLVTMLPMSRVMLIPPLASRTYRLPAPSLAKSKLFTDFADRGCCCPAPPRMTL